MTLHSKSPNVICINQQSDLLMYSSGQKKGGAILAAHCITQNRRTPPSPPPPPPTPPHPVTSTQLNIPKSCCFLQHFILCSKMEPLLQNGANFLAWRIDALLQGFIVLLRSILSEPGDEKICLRGFGPVKIQSGMLSYRC